MDESNSWEVLQEALVGLGRALQALAFWAALLALTSARGLVNLLAQICHVAILVCAAAAKLAIIALMVAATFNAAVQIWYAYGADVPALIVAALLVITLIGLGLKQRNWGSLLIGGLAAYAIGTAVGALDIVTRSLVIVGALATTIAQHQIANAKESDSHAAQKQHHLHNVNQDRVDRLHSGPLDRPGDEHDAGGDQDFRPGSRVRVGPGALGLGQLYGGPEESAE